MSCRLIAPLDRNSKAIFYDNTVESVYALRWYLAVGAGPCVRPAGTSYDFLPFWANSQCLPRADTQVRPYGGQGRCSGITRHVTLSDCPVKRQTQWRHRNACLRTTLVFDRRGGPMCPPSGNIIRFSHGRTHRSSPGRDWVFPTTINDPPISTRQTRTLTSMYKKTGFHTS